MKTRDIKPGKTYANSLRDLRTVTGWCRPPSNDGDTVDGLPVATARGRWVRYVYHGGWGRSALTAFAKWAEREVPAADTMVTTKTTRTARVRVSKMMTSASCGPDGVPCYQIMPAADHPGDAHPSVGGLDLQSVIMEPLDEGAEVLVTVEVVRRGKRTSNPWLAKKRRK